MFISYTNSNRLQRILILYYLNNLFPVVVSFDLVRNYEFTDGPTNSSLVLS